MKQLVYPVSFAILLAIDHLFGSYLLHGVGWVYLLPNHDYLYIFAWVPLICLFITRLAQQRIRGLSSIILSSVLGLGGVIYILSGGAQLWRMPIIPFGLITLAMGIVLIREANNLLKSSCIYGSRRIGGIAIGGLCLIVSSTIYIQPWALALELPNVQNEKFAGIDLSNTHFNLTNFQNVNLEHADFTGASLIAVNFEQANLDGVSFRNATIESADFNKSSLVGADFTNARIYQTSFTKPI